MSFIKLEYIAAKFGAILYAASKNNAKKGMFSTLAS